ncbi:DUF1508 domain-containing protein [Amycolatopsis minnesotensis]
MKCGDGELVASGEAYETRANVINGAEAVRRVTAAGPAR